MKILINSCFGGYGLSKAVYDELLEQKALTKDCMWYEKWNSFECHLKRNDPILLTAVEKIGLLASSGNCAKLTIVEVPDDLDWEIHEYDGMETVHEKHRSWG